MNRLAMTCLALFSMAAALGCRSGSEQPPRSIYKGHPERPDGAGTWPASVPALDGLNSARISKAPTSGSPGLGGPNQTVPIMRVVLTPTEIRIDNSELVSFLTEGNLIAEEGREQHVPTHIHPEAQSHLFPWPVEAAGYQLAALQDASARMRHQVTILLGANSMDPSIEISEEDAERLDRRVWLFVDRNLPYDKLAKVVYSLAVAGIDGLAIMVEGRSGGVLLDVALPALCDNQSEVPSPCTHLVFVSTQEGLHATAHAAGESADGCLAPTRSPTEDDTSTTDGPGWDGLQILGDDGSCPALLRTDGVMTSARVGGLLEEVAELGAVCSAATLLAPPDHVWQPLAEALAALLANELRVVLGADTEFSGMAIDDEWRSCEPGFLPAEASTHRSDIHSTP